MRWLVAALWLTGCGVVVPPEPAAQRAVFPHPDGYALAHGADAAFAPQACGGCHALRDGEQVAGVSPQAPACRSCHGRYPHPEEFADGATHGAAWQQQPGTCTACHGGRGELAPANALRGQCATCHSTYPHPTAWPAEHGAAARARGLAACLTCHGADGGRVAAADCHGCHDFPHGGGWVAGHGEVARADLGCGGACHPTAADGTGRVACDACHVALPHPEGWTAAHPAAVQAGAGCDRCHPAGVRGPALPVSCGPGCHDGGAP